VFSRTETHALRPFIHVFPFVTGMQMHSLAYSRASSNRFLVQACPSIILLIVEPQTFRGLPETCLIRERTDQAHKYSSPFEVQSTNVSSNQREWRCSCGLRHSIDSWVDISVSEKHTASIFKTELRTTT
jgi:hypothetical protein